MTVIFVDTNALYHILRKTLRTTEEALAVLEENPGDHVIDAWFTTRSVPQQRTT